MPRSYPRALRVADLIRRELSRLLLREVKDPRLQAVVVTQVELSADLRHATVFFSGDSAGARAAAQDGLSSAAGFLRKSLGRSLHLRYAPELAFEADESVDKSLHITALLKQLHTEDPSE
jgi:ribosome-binding factor A